MNAFKIIVSALFIFGCKSSTSSFESKSFNSKTSELFFNADIRNKYDNLINFFKTVNGLKEAETGWTVYPPLSALDGLLIIRKIGPNQDALAVLEINIEFKSKNAADAFYKETISDFNGLQLDKEESILENIRSTVFHENGTSSVLMISVFSYKEDDLYSVTLRLLPGDS